ncbi:MAG: type II toxin-antitoxin system RelB/DinJ family antitoxin [Planctomycetes bacterium]|jgi:DNA-damage-inducible protein J|nr:type II toxin-antitoxin system RelB/DinJ family antitoxin [Planctomycetota bacterium]
MNSAIINIKTDIKVKKEAQKVTNDLGLSLSGAINGFLRQLIRDKSVLFTLNENAPSDYLLSSIKESRAERKNGGYHSFKNNRAAIKFLDNK